ncbi:MAG: tRNA pseudouridine(38-40) synthase TruA, partial [Bacilli bacterium]|nr:tRNA pseudouridine(38-40) synthase TruA [Bacilli bacterium]
PDIHVINTEKVDNKFHARYGVKEKEYKYFLNMGEYDPTKRNYCYQYCRELDVKSMQEAIKYFIGEHDFESFTPTVDKRDNNVRTITKATLEEHDNILTFTFRGNGFIKYQVRNMVGYLIKVGEGKKKGSDIPNILLGKDRRLASITAHSEGLYLTDVKY